MATREEELKKCSQKLKRRKFRPRTEEMGDEEGIIKGNEKQMETLLYNYYKQKKKNRGKRNISTVKYLYN